MSDVTKEELENRFRYHDPVGNQNDVYNTIRRECFELAKTICEVCPNSRERSVALTKLDEVMFWSNASIART